MRTEQCFGKVLNVMALAADFGDAEVGMSWGLQFSSAYPERTSKRKVREAWTRNEQSEWQNTFCVASKVSVGHDTTINIYSLERRHPAHGRQLMYAKKLGANTTHSAVTGTNWFPVEISSLPHRKSLTVARRRQG